MLKNKEDIDEWLIEHDVYNYTINEDLSVDVDGDVNLYKMNLSSIDVQFNIVSGTFDCGSNFLETLDFCPKKVGESFDCSDNQLTNLDFCPSSVNGSFNCSGNKLISLKGCPQSVLNFDCSKNQLTNLEGCPKKINGDLYCHNNQLTSLKYSPNIIGRSFYCEFNKLTNLEYAPQKIGGAFAFSNNLINIDGLEGFPLSVGENIYCKNNFLGEFQNITDFNQMKKVLEVKKYKEVLEQSLNQSNKEKFNLIKI